MKNVKKSHALGLGLSALLVLGALFTAGGVDVVSPAAARTSSTAYPISPAPLVADDSAEDAYWCTSTYHDHYVGCVSTDYMRNQATATCSAAGMSISGISYGGFCSGYGAHDIYYHCCR